MSPFKISLALPPCLLLASACSDGILPDHEEDELPLNACVKGAEKGKTIEIEVIERYDDKSSYLYERDWSATFSGYPACASSAASPGTRLVVELIDPRVRGNDCYVATLRTTPSLGPENGTIRHQDWVPSDYPERTLVGLVDLKHGDGEWNALLRAPGYRPFSQAVAQELPPLVLDFRRNSRSENPCADEWVAQVAVD